MPDCWKNRWIWPTLLAGLLLAGPLWARDYAVELLVFERASLPGEVEEQWNSGSNSQLSHMENLAEFVARAGDQPRTPSVSRLKRLESELLGSGYRVLYSARWQQPAAVYQDAPVVGVSNPDGRLEGAIRVYRTSLIFADLMLGLADLVPNSEAPLYFISEKRRLKFKEVHYFDHPRFGALVAVWPAD